MGDFSQAEFLTAKKALDKVIKHTGKLAEQAEGAMVHCCRSDELDARDAFASLAAELRLAQGHMMRARAIGGGIQTGDGVIARGGST